MLHLLQDLGQLAIAVAISGVGYVLLGRLFWRKDEF